MSQAKRELDVQTMLDDIQEMIDLEVIDPDDEEDAAVITAMTMYANGETLDKEQEDLLNKRVGGLMDDLDDARTRQSIDYSIDKDD